MQTLWVLSRTASLIAGLGLAVALGPHAGAQPAVTANSVVGVWQFHPPPCGSGNAMGLNADGSVWITESLRGTWRLDGSVLRFVVDELDMDVAYDSPVVIARDVQMSAELVTLQPDYLELRWDNGHIGHAWRCR
jgi:hypothetical protein